MLLCPVLNGARGTKRITQETHGSQIIKSIGDHLAPVQTPDFLDEDKEA